MSIYLGMNILMKAASKDNTDMLKILLEHGADVNSRSDQYGELHTIIVTIVFYPSFYIPIINQILL